MSDADQTILSSSGPGGVSGAPQQPEKKRNPLLIIGGIGCALLLCAGLLIGGGIYLAGDQINELTSGITGQEEPMAAPPPPETPTTAPTPTPEPAPTEETTETDAAVEEASPEPEPEDIGPPEIGAITFALGATEDYDPIDPGDSFEGEVTEIHAIFEYSGLSPDFNWERVWYLDGNEMLRSEEAWSGAEAGVFDYFINAGGEALSPGEWLLELYVEGELLASDTFVIEAEAVAESPTATPTATAEAEPTETPTATAEATSAPAASAPQRGGGTYPLVYTKWDGGRHNLYIGDTDGSTDQFIMNNAAGPSWTPGGSQIFFFGEPGVNLQDRSVNPGVGSCELPGVSDGVVVIDAPSPPSDFCVVMGSFYQGPGWNDGTARWTSVSPDGSMVAYDAKPGGDYRIYFLGTADNQQFTFEILGEQADWSPDSQKLAYRSGRDGKTGIWISNRDDSGHTLITTDNDSFPAWSPDGDTIAFARDENGDVNIYTANIDGTNIQQLTDAPGPDTLPIYTPDGQIIFRSARSGSWGIWKMNGDGSNQVEIIPNAGVGPDWAYSKMSVMR